MSALHGQALQGNGHDFTRDKRRSYRLAGGPGRPVYSVSRTVVGFLSRFSRSVSTMEGVADDRSRVRPPMKRITILFALLAISALLTAACGVGVGSSSSGNAEKPKPGPEKAAGYAPKIVPSDFTTRIENKYFPLKPGTTFVYRGKTEDASEGDTVHVTSDTKNVMGVECVVVDDRVTEDGELTEQTYDWYAQDAKGNVWYFGEDSKEYENGKVKSTEGSWEAGKHGAKPGIIMPASPKVGETYRQEYLKGIAEDMARPVKLDGSTTVPYGTFHNVLVTDEWTPLEKNVAEQKYYAPGVGNVLELATRGPKERLELIDVKYG